MHIFANQEITILSAVVMAILRCMKLAELARIWSEVNLTDPNKVQQFSWL